MSALFLTGNQFINFTSFFFLFLYLLSLPFSFLLSFLFSSSVEHVSEALYDVHHLQLLSNIGVKQARKMKNFHQVRMVDVLNRLSRPNHRMKDPVANTIDWQLLGSRALRVHRFTRITPFWYVIVSFIFVSRVLSITSIFHNFIVVDKNEKILSRCRSFSILDADWMSTHISTALVSSKRRRSVLL